MSEQISIVKRRCCWFVESGRVSRGVLWFYAPGLEIYVTGEGASRQFDTIANIAMNEAQSRHIPAGSLKTAANSHNAHGGQAPATGKPQQKALLPTEDDMSGGD